MKLSSFIPLALLSFRAQLVVARGIARGILYEDTTSCGCTVTETVIATVYFPGTCLPPQESSTAIGTPVPTSTSSSPLEMSSSDITNTSEQAGETTTDFPSQITGSTFISMTIRTLSTSDSDLTTSSAGGVVVTPTASTTQLPTTTSEAETSSDEGSATQTPTYAPTETPTEIPVSTSTDDGEASTTTDDCTHTTVPESTTTNDGQFTTTSGDTPFPTSSSSTFPPYSNDVTTIPTITDTFNDGPVFTEPPSHTDPSVSSPVDTTVPPPIYPTYGYNSWGKAKGAEGTDDA